MNRRIALPGHRFQIIALDGNPVPTPQSVEVLYMGPGERVDAVVEMNQPGVWILGTDTDDVRNDGYVRCLRGRTPPTHTSLETPTRNATEPYTFCPPRS